MNIKKELNKRDARRKARTRAKLEGTATRPRLSVFKSNSYLYVQAIDDGASATITQASSLTDTQLQKSKRDQLAAQLGALIAERLKEKKIGEAILDRGAYQYHGFIKKFAEEIRKNGIRI